MVSVNGKLVDVLTNALEPHKEVLSGWSVDEIGMLFMGFGNVSIYPTNIETYNNDDDIGGTFAENSVAIIDALNNIGIDLGESNWDSSDIYWLIHSYSGEVRADLINSLNVVGYDCYKWFDAEEEDIKPLKVEGWNAEPSI